MRYQITKRILLFSVSFFIAFTYLSAQEVKVQKSPRAVVSQDVGNTKVSITYHRPAVNDREIWGGLVPFDKVWRTGANNASTIEFSTDVKIDGKEIKAGKYAIFTIPSKNEWKIMLNSEYDQWGSSKYDSEKDVIKISSKPEESRFNELMSFNFSLVTETSSDVVLEWEKLKIKFNIDSYLSSKPDAEEVRPSPNSLTTQRIGLTDITVNYSSPGVKDRKIWGGLVPYDSPWRSGANLMTTIEFNNPVTIQGNSIAAGEYGLFTIPTKNDWTVIISKTTGRWNPDEYSETNDVARFSISPKQNDNAQERLTYLFDELTENSGTLILAWENLNIPIKIKTGN